MLDIVEINEQVFEFLEKERAAKPKLRYAFRKSNYNDRLTEGYWFYGTEKYLAVSFWSGMDWKNRTPNISFVILRNGETALEINVSDSEKKRKFVEQFLVGPLELIREGRRYVKRYSYDEIAVIESLNVFINGFNKQKSDKEIIDKIIEKNSPQYFDDLKSEDTIYSINGNEFRSRLLKIQKYIELRKLQETESDRNLVINDRPNKLLDFSIKNYGIIKTVLVDNIPANNRWIFITGENGSGKTNLLRGLATALGGRQLKKIDNDKPFRVSMNFVKNDVTYDYERINNDGANLIRRPVVSGLAMYGPYRLDIVNEKISTTKFKKELGKNESFKSIFETGIPLLNIDKQFEIWYTEKKEKEKFEKRKYFIKSIFVDLVPSLFNIHFEVKEGNKRVTKYLVKNDPSEIEREISWSELSSGTKSVFAMVGDIMIRLFDQQRNVIDPSDLTGIVIIDEIDLHLHPKAQKELVVNLTKAFPNVQFIVSTHSPIPLLGAPASSVFIKVERPNDFMEIERLENKIPIRKLLPNALLGSPLFDLDDFSPIDKEINELLTQDNYEDALYNYLLKKRFDQLNILQHD